MRDGSTCIFWTTTFIFWTADVAGSVKSSAAICALSEFVAKAVREWIAAVGEHFLETTRVAFV
jgi:hypothetical protein